MAKGQEETRTGEGQRESTREPQKEPRSHDTRGKQGETKSPEQSREIASTKPQETGMVHHHDRGHGGGWRSLTRMRHEFDRLFDEFSRGWLGFPVGLDGGWGSEIRETDDSVIVRAEVPGFEPSDFTVRVRGDQLVMCACRKGEEERQGGSRGWQRKEFHATVTLPADVSAEKVKATYRHGVLTVTLPKSEEDKAQRINVEG